MGAKLMSNNVTWNYGFAWDDNLSTQNEEVDYQHKTLFKLVSDVLESNQKGDSKEKISERLNFLSNYVAEHFEYEEKLMRQSGFAGYTEHQEMHKAFIKTAISLIDDFHAKGASDDMAEKVDTVVITWLIEHIRAEDIKIAEHIRSLK